MLRVLWSDLGKCESISPIRKQLLAGCTQTYYLLLEEEKVCVLRAKPCKQEKKEKATEIGLFINHCQQIQLLTVRRGIFP